MKPQLNTELIDAARQIAPILRDHSDEAERDRRLSKPALEALVGAGLFRMFTPRSLDGLEVDPITCARVIEEVSRADSATGWSLQNPLSWAFMCSRLPDGGAEELFARNADVLIAGPFHPPMKAVPVDGGYHVTERSPLASNCRDANWIGASAMVMDGDKPRMTESSMPEVVVVFLSIDDCKILDTWYVMGMRGTGSDDIAVTDAFVPRVRTFPLAADFEPGSHSA